VIRAAIKLALSNLLRGDRIRTAVAVLGVAVATFLVILHLGLMHAVKHKATEAQDLFEFDLALISTRYQFLYSAADFPEVRLKQAAAVPGVRATMPVRIDNTYWVHPGTELSSSVLLIGVGDDPRFLREPNIRAALPGLRESRKVLLDAFADKDFGPAVAGGLGRIRGQEATIIGSYRLGLPMYANGTAVTANADFSLFTGNPHENVRWGLIQADADVDLKAAAARLRAALPVDVQVLTRAEFIERERAYFVAVKPLGILLRSGMLIGLVVGAVALYQALAAQIESRLREFAVLRALGFAHRFTLGVAIAQLIIMTLVGGLLAFAAAIPVFVAISSASQLALEPNVQLVAGVSGYALAMAALCAALSLARTARADPATAFRGA
jgi:putative ABC transport system permease protein